MYWMTWQTFIFTCQMLPLTFPGLGSVYVTCHANWKITSLSKHWKPLPCRVSENVIGKWHVTCSCEDTIFYHFRSCMIVLQWTMNTNESCLNTRSWYGKRSNSSNCMFSCIRVLWQQNGCVLVSIAQCKCHRIPHIMVAIMHYTRRIYLAVNWQRLSIIHNWY
jgi:hypothetical protein